MKNWSKMLVLFFLFAGIAYPEEVPLYSRHVIRISPDQQFDKTSTLVWKDINRDGLEDLLLISPFGKVLIYRQNPSGFSTNSSENIIFPKGTAWFTMADVCKSPGLEILISTPEGLKYYSQNENTFKSLPQTLIKIKQIFCREALSSIYHFEEEKLCLGKKVQNNIPVFLSDHILIYKQDANYHYKQSANIELKYNASICKEPQRFWSLSKQGTYKLRIQIKKLEVSEHNKTKDLRENIYIEQMLKKIGEDEKELHGIEKKDINGDGQQDIILWHMANDIDRKTTFLVMLRQSDGNLPPKPFQVIRCYGVPAVWNYDSFSPFIDVNNDGFLDIVLLEVKNRPSSIESFLKLATSKEVTMIFKIKLYEKTRGFSNKSNCEIVTKAVTPSPEYWSDIIRFGGDFNGDNRPDFIIRRTHTQSEVYFSSLSDNLYSRKPALQFKVPAESWTFVDDLNSDGLSDIYLIDYHNSEITVFLSTFVINKGS